MGISNTQKYGHLAPLFGGVQQHLLAQGYAPGTVANQLRLMARLVRWLDEHGHEISDLVPRVLDGFSARRRSEGCAMVRHTWSLMPILRGLDSLTATPPTLIAELTVRRANRPRTRIRGPLTPFVAGVRDGLLAQGYVATTAAQLLMVMAHLSRWMEDGGLAIGDLVPSRLGEFADARRDEGYARHVTVRGLSPVLSALENCGVVFPPAPPAVLCAHGKIRASFVEYLAVERGLGAETVGYYGDIAARFLRYRFGDAAPTLGELGAVDVVGFVLRGAKEAGSTETARHIASGLRAFLRWLYLRGDTAHALSGAVPSIAGWRMSTIPAGLTSEEVDRVLAGCDRQKVGGLRAYAVLTLLVRLALRRGEVAALTLDDLDWERGELLVRGKGSKQACLPMPSDVGEALAAYLQVRPAVPSRSIFLRLRAPFRALTPGAISPLVRTALVRAGVNPGRQGAHVLRHTAATRMLDAGSPLTEIAQVLRHDSIDTTAIYAKVDLASLGQLVRPWPGGVA